MWKKYCERRVERSVKSSSRIESPDTIFSLQRTKRFITFACWSAKLFLSTTKAIFRTLPCLLISRWCCKKNVLHSMSDVDRLLSIDKKYKNCVNI